MSNVRSVFAPHLGTHVKLGCKLPKVRGYAPRLRNYLTAAALPAPPASSDYTPPAMSVLKDILGNDRAGCCVLASILHTVAVLTGGAGNLANLTTQDALRLYSELTGYNPNDPNSDQGTDPEMALNWWRDKGCPTGSGHKILGWLRVNEADANELRTTLYLFENLHFALGLPDAYVDPFPAGDGFTWDVAGPAIPSNGHMFCGAKQSAAGIGIDTWALMGTFTFPAIAAYCSQRAGGAVYTAVSLDALNRATQKAPNGLDATSLVTDFDAMGGNLPVPGPGPVNPPPVNPPPPIANLKQQIDAVFANARSVITRTWAKWAQQPALVALDAVQKQVDAILAQYSATRWAAGVLVPSAVQVLDAAFAAAEAAMPQYALYLKIVQRMVDAYLAARK